MKKQHIILLALELLLLASPFVKWTRDLYSVDTGRAVFDSFVLFVTMQVVLLGVAWHFALHDEVGHVRSQLGGITARISGRGVVRIRDDEFYSEFLTATRRASSRVLISYFARRLANRVQVAGI